MKTYFLSGILLSALLPVGAAEARPADCLVVLEGRTYIDGQCDFQAENGGDFTIRQGSRTAKVTVDPGSREGRAFFEDTSPRNPQSLVWDVRRQGACWVDGSSRICAWDIGQRPQAQGGGQGGFAQAPQQQMPQQQGGGRGRTVSFFNQDDGGFCMVATRPQAEANVILGDCSSPGARFIVDAPAKRIRLASNPSLCVDGTVGGEPTYVWVMRCQDAYDEFVVRGNRLQSRDSCAGVQGPVRLNARMATQPCGGRRGQGWVVNDPIDLPPAPPPQAQAPQQWSPPPQAQQMPPQAPATRMIRMDSAPGRFTLAREMQGNRLLRCVVQGPPDEGLRVSYYPNTSGRRAFSIPGNRAPDGTQDTLTVTLIPGNGGPTELQARHNGGRVAADLPDAISTTLSDATTMEVQFGSSGETRTFDLSTYGEVESAVDGCLTSFGPSQDDAMRQAERDYQRQQQAQRPAPQPPVAYAPPAQQGSGQVFRFPFARAGAWEIRRLSDLPDGRRTTGCVVDSNDQMLRNVRFAVDGGNAIIDFRDGGDLRRLPRRFQVQIQFGTNTRSYTFPAEVVDEGFGPWIRLMTARNFQSGIENADQLIIRTPSGLVTLPLFDGDRLWPAMARCIAAMR